MHATSLNTMSKIINLQFGCGKCSQMHIGKVINEDICPLLTVDAWDEEIVDGEKIKKRQIQMKGDYKKSAGKKVPR